MDIVFSPAGGLVVCLVSVLMFGNASAVKKANFDKLAEGMSVSEVNKTMGRTGTCVRLVFPENVFPADSASEVAGGDEPDVYFWRVGTTNFVVGYDQDKKLMRKIIVETDQKPTRNAPLFTLKLLRQSLVDEMAQDPEIQSNPFASMFFEGFLKRIDEEIEKLE